MSSHEQAMQELAKRMQEPKYGWQKYGLPVEISPVVKPRVRIKARSR